MKKDFFITVAWPNKRIRLTPRTKRTEKIGIMNASHGTIKVGHVGAILVDGKNGDAEYYDFGRYQTSNGMGRVRGPLNDKIYVPNANIKNGKITNISDMLAELQNNAIFHGYGNLLASINHNISFQNAKSYVMELMDIGEITYCAIKPYTLNCAKFVKELFIKGVENRIQSLTIFGILDMSPSTIGLVLTNSSMKFIYSIEDKKLFKARLTIWLRLKLILIYVFRIKKNLSLKK